MWAAGLEADARRHGVGFRLKDAPTERRLRLYGALVMLAAADATAPELIRALLARARTDAERAVLSAEVSLGHALGACDADTALRLIREVELLEAGELVASVAQSGELTLVGPAKV
jgi:transposase